MSAKKQKGQSAVEFALLVVVTIVMFLAMTQFGLYLYGLGAAENAARNGARAGSVAQACPACQAVSAARSSLSGLPVIYDPSVTILAPGGVVGSTVKIRVSARIPLIIPGGSLFGLDRILEVNAEATFRQEGW
jgi:predicted ABC-type sugar transport system permease subunit